MHLDSRMDVYGQSEASVIEVSENCKHVADGNVRKIDNKDFHVSIKDKIANFDGVVKSPIYCALVFNQTFDVQDVLLQA